MPRHIIVKLLKTKEKENHISSRVKKPKHYTQENNHFSNLHSSPNTKNLRRSWTNTFRKLKSIIRLLTQNFYTQCKYPSKIKAKTFSDN